MNEAIAAIDGDGLENNDGNHQRAGRTERMIVNQTGREWCFLSGTGVTGCHYWITPSG
jgi:hypothetical protein